MLSFIRRPSNLFSVTKYWRRLFVRDPEVITCIPGLRVIATAIVVAGHRAEALASGPLMNPESIEKVGFINFLENFNDYFLTGF